MFYLWLAIAIGSAPVIIALVAIFGCWLAYVRQDQDEHQ